MRTLTDHIVCGGKFPQLNVYAVDSPEPGGASHEYRISGHDLSKHPVYANCSGRLVPQWDTIPSAAGPLLAVVIDRLRSFQAGPLSCRENATYLRLLHRALCASKGHSLRYRSIPTTRCSSPKAFCSGPGRFRH